MEKKEPTVEQLRIARAHRIPKSQAHTINVDKARGYHRWIKSEDGQVERFLDTLKEKHI